MSLGDGIVRKDGLVKVTGRADYMADHHPAGMLYAVAVQSRIAAGAVRSVDTRVASASPGVIRIFTHHDFPRLKPGTLFPRGSLETRFLPLQDENIRFSGQHVALAVARTLQQAQEAARLLIIDYREDPLVADIDDPRGAALSAEATQPSPFTPFDTVRGDPDGALASAPTVIKADYGTPRQQHAAMEPHGAIAAWNDDTGFTVWESTQWAEGARAGVAEWFGLPFAMVRVISPYVGGAFGSKVRPQAHLALACGAARVLGQPVCLQLSRAQTFTGPGPRAATRQTIRIGAERDGRIVALEHRCLNDSAVGDHFAEAATGVSQFVYAIPNVRTQQRVKEANMVKPTTFRAPGYASGAFALECAVDELAHELAIDPLALRLRNEALVDPRNGHPWSSRRLREACEAGAAAFGWNTRPATPRAMKKGRELIGWGMAAGGMTVVVTPAEAAVQIKDDGRVSVKTSGSDMGNGTYTILAQLAADTLGVPVERVDVWLGDTSLPRSPSGSASQLANSLTRVVLKVASKARAELVALATQDTASPLHGADAKTLVIADGRISASGKERFIGIGDLLRRTGRKEIAVLDDTLPDGKRTEADRLATFHSVTRTGLPSHEQSVYTWAAQFAEVSVDEDFGTIHVTRMVGAFDCGRIYNSRLATSQWEGAMIMGMSAALFEGLEIDRRYGRTMNNNLADYLLPVAADVPKIKAISVGQPDLVASPLGGKSAGEIGMVGVAAAIANAVFHATGKRVRDLPIRMESLL